MAERAQQLVRYLIEFIPKVSDHRILEALVSLKDALEASQPHLDRADWNRETDAVAATSIRNINELLYEIEIIISNYNYYLFDLSDKEEFSEITVLIYEFLGNDRNLLREGPTEFSDLFECFAKEACERLKRHLWLIRFESEDAEIVFVDRNEGWVEPAFNPPNLL